MGVERNSFDWLGSYSSMEKEEPKEYDETPPMNETTTKSKAEIKAERSYQQALAMLRFMFTQNQAKEEAHKRATTIKRIQPNSIPINQKSLDGYLFKALSASNDGLHINAIIEQMEALGWKSNSKYHKYNHVKQAIRDSYYMYMKTAPATYKLRDGFRGQAPKIEAIKPKKKYNTRPVKLEDLIAFVMKKYQTKYGLYPASVWFVLRRMGCNCSYRGVYDAMQNKDRFARDGFWYQVKRNDRRKKTKGSKSASQR